jgi:DNA-directed RNA polymerase subunit RPC12/RpoP
MSDMSLLNFKCPTCGAEYEVVRTEAPPGPTTDREIVCLNCGGPLRGQILFDLATKAGNRRAIFPEGSQAVAGSLADGLEQERPVSSCVGAGSFRVNRRGFFAVLLPLFDYAFDRSRRGYGRLVHFVVGKNGSHSASSPRD